MRDWSALEEAAGALRRLNRAIAGRDLSDDALRDVARVADQLAAELHTEPLRSKEDDMATHTDLAAAMAGQPMSVPVGAALEFDPFSAGGGRLHPASVGMRVRRDDAVAVVATSHVDPMFQGPPGRVHGGIVAVLIDELMGTVNRMLGQRAYTARLAIDYRAPAPIDVELTFRAWLHDQEGRKVILRADGRSDAGLFVEAEGLFVIPRLDTIDAQRDHHAR
jgi:acyl-coenzyme A thioesterase PaaI-like protein